MGGLMRTHDWSRTALGPVEDWPQSLRIAVRILLGSSYPMLIGWGPDYTMVYNDACRPVLGQTKHPGALGRSCQEVFSDAWDFIGPLVEKTCQGQDASTLTDQLFLLERNGYQEETYFTVSCSPIPDDNGEVGGVFLTTLETTERVIEDRRRRVLRDLASRVAEARSEEEVCRIAAVTASETPLFLPFLLLYLYDPENNTARLVASTGTAEPDLCMETVDCRSGDVWPFSAVLAAGTPQIVDDLESRFQKAPLSPWNTPVRAACVMPIQLRGRREPAGFFVGGINPRREFDESYRQAFQQMADQIAAGMASARIATGINQQMLQNALITSQRFAAIVESSEDAIVSKDLNGNITSWNPTAERMFGYTAEEMVGRSILQIIPPELHGDEQRILQTIASGRRIEHFETVRLTKDGRRIDVSLTISPVRNDAGAIVGAAKIARDITRRKQTEQALRMTERLASVGRLAASIAHEINNPLEGLTNLVYLAKQNTAEANTRELLRSAEEELARVSLLTRQTLGFYRERASARAFTISSLLTPLMAAYMSRIRNKGIIMQPEIREDPEICGIAGEIRQVVANLLSNSIDAVSPGGRIRVRISAAREWKGQQRRGARLTIADSGIGIPREAQKRIYQPFFTTKKDTGTGLGLWVCHGIVEKHGGRISLLSSTAPGRSGTAFSIFLPLDGDNMERA